MQIGRLTQNIVTLPTPNPPSVLTDPTRLSAATLKVKLGLALAPPARSVVTTPAGGIKNNSPVADARTEADILNEAQKAGLSTDELVKLKQILDNSPDFKSDAAMLQSFLRQAGDPNWSNGDRALRTFMDLDEMRRQYPDRITPDIMNSLVMGVAHGKSGSQIDEFEGVLGENSARRAAQALIAMPQVDYDALHSTLNQAGKGGDIYSDAETERALILKAVSARADQYEHPTVNDSIVRPETLEIETFSNQIRGMNRDALIAHTTVVADGDTLRQRYYDSCSATAAQMTKAEADPIYAWKLQHEDVNGSDLGGFIGDQQAELMQQVSGMPVSFQELQLLQQIIDAGGPAGAAAKALRDQLLKQGSNLEKVENNFASDTTGRDYHSYSVGNDAGSRTAAVDYIDKLVRQGVDVPISVNWENRDWRNPLKLDDNGLSHALVITDVRGQGADEVFVVADPGGATYEVKRSDLIGGANFGGSQGRLSEFLY
jgi:hypothetical protein